MYFLSILRTLKVVNSNNEQVAGLLCRALLWLSKPPSWSHAAQELHLLSLPVKEKGKGKKNAQAFALVSYAAENTATKVLV